MKKNLQMLALGFLISALLLFVYVQFFSTDTQANQKKDTANSTEVKKWKQKYSDLLAKQELEKTKQAEDSAKKEEEQKQADAKKQDAAKKEQAEKNKVKKYTLRIAKGDPSSKAGEVLESEGIIKSAKDFDKFLRKNDYEKYVRDGKYKLSSDMSYEKIAKVLAHKN